MRDKSIHINESDNYRIVVVSDIHAHLEGAKRLLEKTQLKESDYLIILGDFVNRGPESYATYEYVRHLNKRPRTYVLKGNHESFMQRPVESNDHFDQIYDYLKCDPYRTLIHDCAKRSNFDFYNCEDAELFRQHLLSQFKDMFTYLRELPVILYLDDFIFVHGGYDPTFSLEEDETEFLRFDFFNDKAPIQEKIVIVGHSPACNYRETYLSNAPFFNVEKNIINIDGGCGVKPTGELNAFIIKKEKGEIQYDWLQENDFDEAIVYQPFEFHEEDPIHLRWPKRSFDIVERGRVMTLCEHHGTGKKFHVFNSLLIKEKDVFVIKRDYANTFFNLSVGTTVELCQLFEDCALVKYDGIFGWLRREQLMPDIIF